MSEQLITVIWAGLLAGGFALAGGALSSWQARKNLRLQLAHDQRTALNALRHTAYAEYLAAADELFTAVTHMKLAEQAPVRVWKFATASERARLLAPLDTAAKIREHSMMALDSTSERMNQITAGESAWPTSDSDLVTVARLAVVALMRRDLAIPAVAEE